MPAFNNWIDKIGLRETIESALDKAGLKKIEDLNSLNKDKKNDLLKQVGAEWNVKEEELESSLYLSSNEKV